MGEEPGSGGAIRAKKGSTGIVRIVNALEGQRHSLRRRGMGDPYPVWTADLRAPGDPLLGSSVSMLVLLHFSVEEKPLMLFVLLYLYFYLV